MRFVSLVLTSLWIGGLAVLGGVAAPAVFDVLQAHDPAAGRTLAGELFGVILARNAHALWIAGGAQIAVLAARAMSRRPPRLVAAQMLLLAAMLGATTYTAVVIGPTIDAIRTSTPGPIASLPDDSTVKREFGRLHGLSNGLMLAAFAGAMALLWIDRKDPAPERAVTAATGGSRRSTP